MGHTNGNSKRFSTDERKLSTAVVEAVAAVTGKDPLEMDPLYDTVDPETLESTIDDLDDGELSFTLAGVNVTVTNSAEIIVEDTEGESRLNRTLVDASNVLLSSSRDNHGDEACVSFVSQSPPSETNLLGITYSQGAYERLGRWEGDEGEYPSNTTVVDVGARTRSAASDSTGTIDFPSDPFTIRTIADETDLVSLGELVVNELAEWEYDDNQTVVCFHSVTALLEHVDTETAFKLLQIITSRLGSGDVNAHYHINPEAHDEQTLLLFSELFDAVVTVGDDRVWSISTR